ncbi:MAG: peptidase [Gammaproteobacteria bacterium]|jgi:putative proteasome-type protease
MTYCLAISVNDGLVFCSDSRTNAGIDQISTYSKMFRFGIDGQRQFIVLSAGNLATTQAVIAQLKLDIKRNAPVNLVNVSSIFEASDYLGEISQQQQTKHSGRSGFEASFIIGGQIAGSKPEAILVYPEGNHITTSEDTPYLQIGESKYGKPILDRILTLDLNLDTCALCALVSMDSTMRSNLTVGPPVEVMVYRTDSLVLDGHHRFDSDSEFLRELSKGWDQRLKDAFRQMPPLAWAATWDKPGNGHTENS